MIFEIFSDGSSYLGDEYRASSSAYKIYLYGRPVIHGGKYLDGETSNHAEAQAVLEALRQFERCIKKVRAADVKPPYRVNFFTDSLITRDACKTNIFKWVRLSKNGVMFNSAGDPIFSQEIFWEIYNKFLTNEDYEINFFHVNSHCIDRKFLKDSIDRINDCIIRGKCDKQLMDKLRDTLYGDAKFKKAKKSFRENNGMNIDNTELLRLLICNLEVDGIADELLDDGLAKLGITRKKSRGAKKGGKERKKELQKA